ncbi:flagellar hook capping FlgD N-terminal domain-containing protein [Paenibacillus bouchesdurhonensis]|uniref:flagellar hook capping FlgD N-terminal domain-containing protein n=1 Tax=Paenibacillus bouchesdurhonensis TaxID=1870990 RepID=UPI000DA60911|nr:flagellar hook capping FlgD N-terminal domain-containing protein [Paenibacillus bouchesdurhonensis]
MSNFPSVSWPGYSSTNVTSKSNEDNQTLGKDQFLKILITQLQNQDPMQPLQDKEFIAQMATFTSVEQLMNISKQLDVMNQSLGTVSGLIGKRVSWIETEYTGEYDIKTGEKSVTSSGSGIVEGIVIRNNVQYAKVGAKEIKLSDILEIDEVPEETPPGNIETPGSPTDPTPESANETPSTEAPGIPADNSTESGSEQSGAQNSSANGADTP